MTEPTIRQPKQVHELAGMLVAPRPGATSTFEEYAAARATFLEINDDARWNPWVHEDRASEERSATAVMEQWTRAETGFRQLTDPEVQEMLDEVGRRSNAEFAADAARQKRDKERYNAEREQARLSLLEQESILSRQREEMVELRAGRYPAWSEEHRAAKIAEIEHATNARETQIATLAAIVGDREDIVDKYGRLPRDRRKASLLRYRLDREHKVRELRARIPELKTVAAESKDRTERSKLLGELQTAESSLETLLAVPPLTEDDMCSECAQPASHHGWVSPPYDGPCPAWPGWAERLRRAREILYAAAERTKAEEAGPPKPHPIAVLPSGLPIADVITKLSELQKAHPKAIVKRGRANKWEIWHADA
ncbi:hypothetical protein ACX801_21095 [Arthrobacter bambusae]